MTQEIYAPSKTRPENFVYLKDIAPSILQDVRYATHQNFVGSPLLGYNAKTIILTKPAADKLLIIQQELEKFNLSLKVYDAYRPHQTVEAFLAWSQDIHDCSQKNLYYPNVDKQNLFSSGYLSKRSAHSRGSTVDLTITSLDTNQHSPSGFYGFYDGSLNMGTGFDYMDEFSHTLNPHINGEARANRLLLLTLMETQGFQNYSKEWWHFTLKDEPYKDTFFDFPIS